MKVILTLVMMVLIGTAFFSMYGSLGLLLKGSTLTLVGGSIGLLFTTITVYGLYKFSQIDYSEPR